MPMRVLSCLGLSASKTRKINGVRAQYDTNKVRLKEESTKSCSGAPFTATLVRAESPPQINNEPFIHRLKVRSVEPSRHLESLGTMTTTAMQVASQFPFALSSIPAMTRPTTSVKSWYQNTQMQMDNGPKATELCWAQRYAGARTAVAYQLLWHVSLFLRRAANVR